MLPSGWTHPRCHCIRRCLYAVAQSCLEASVLEVSKQRSSFKSGTFSHSVQTSFSVVTLWWGRRPRTCLLSPKGNQTQRRPEYRCQSNTAWFLPWFYPFLDIYCWTSPFRDSVSLSVRLMRSLSIFLIELSCKLKLNCSEQILTHKQWSFQVSHHYNSLWNSNKYKLATSIFSGMMYILHYRIIFALILCKQNKS